MLQSPDKATLRRSLLQERQSMSLEDWRQKSEQVCLHLQASCLFTQARTVLAYFSFRQEPDLSQLFTLAPGNRIWGFPRCQETSLIWHACSPEDGNAFQIGTYGLREPRPDLPVLSAEQVDLLLIPAVACDAQGYRLGYGSGFYDRLLSSPSWQSKPTIGIVFEAARLPALPVAPWDQPVQAVCTEAGLVLAGHISKP